MPASPPLLLNSLTVSLALDLPCIQSHWISLFPQELKVNDFHLRFFTLPDAIMYALEEMLDCESVTFISQVPTHGPRTPQPRGDQIDSDPVSAASTPTVPFLSFLAAHRKPELPHGAAAGRAAAPHAL